MKILSRYPNSTKLPIHPSSLEHLSTFIGNDPISISNTVFPMTLKHFTIRINVLAKSLFFIILVIALVRWTIFPSK